MKKRIIRGCLRIAILAVAGGVLGWLSSILFGERALITEPPRCGDPGREHWHFVRCCVVPGESIAAGCRALGSRR